MYRAVEPARSDGGRATQSTASLLAALCFLLGIAFAAFAPVSPEGRFLVFCFAFAVAIGFYMGGHVLCQAFKLSDKLSGIIEARCAKLLAHFASERLNRHVKNLQTRLNESELELKHLRSEIEIADKAAADLRSALAEKANKVPSQNVRFTPRKRTFIKIPKCPLYANRWGNRPGELVDSGRFWVLRFRLMVKRGPSL